MAKAKYDWIKLKQEYFESDVLESNVFIKQKIGKDGADDGNVARAIKGWTEDKRAWQKQRLENAQKEADKELIGKMKISLEDLLVNKKLLFQLDSRYLEILGKRGSGEELTDSEKEFIRLFPDTLSDVSRRIQTELGLPSNREAFETVEKPENWDEIYEEEFNKWLKERK